MKIRIKHILCEMSLLGVLAPLDVGSLGVDAAQNVACRACNHCRCVFNITWSETCKCLSQTSLRVFVVATVAMPGTTADLHGSSCVIWAQLFRLPLPLLPREGAFLLPTWMFLVFLVRSDGNAPDDDRYMVEITPQWPRRGATPLHRVTVMLVISIAATL